ncbi:hypothetical protein M758_UG338800 [Ceratodon purpureus]|nr:hypothetical protein M758_UG338800 [Ceratodon purpureus]
MILYLRYFLQYRGISKYHFRNLHTLTVVFLFLQTKFPMIKGKDVWVLHPTRVRGPMALGKTGYSFKTTKRILQSAPWGSVKWEIGMQSVEILKVYESGVKVMYPTKQLNRSVRLLDDVKDASCSSDALVVWRSDYLVEVSKSNSKSKKK